MNEFYIYMLRELKDSKAATVAVYNKLKKVERRNRSLTFLALSLTAYMVITTINYKDACRKIDSLNDEILELREKGV